MKCRISTEAENCVTALVEKTPLSTSEIIRCFERNITDVSTTEKVLVCVYPDSVQAIIANEEFTSACSGQVLSCVRVHLAHHEQNR